MPLHMTKIAFQSESPATLRAWLEQHDEEALLTTRYLPKRQAEMTGGSLYWIHGGALVGRSPLLGFAEKPDGKHWIRLAPRLIAVRAMPKRAHQGWRYLEGDDAPADLTGDMATGDIMPAALMGKLAALALI